MLSAHCHVRVRARRERERIQLSIQPALAYEDMAMSLVPRDILWNVYLIAALE